MNQWLLLLPEELSEFLERLWADVVFDSLGIDFGDFGRDIQRQEEIEKASILKVLYIVRFI